jgi:hypothetical protein
VQITHLQSALWYKDTPAQMNTLESNGGNAANIGLRDRAALFALSREVEMIGRLHLDIFHQPKCIPQNCGIKVTLTPSKDAFVLVGPAPGQNAQQENYHIQIMDCRLNIRTLQVSPATILAHEKVLMEKNMHFPMRRVTMKHLAIPRGQTSVLHDNIYLGTLPRRLVLCFVDDVAMAGSYQQNPFNFQHFGINHLALYVNGEMIPHQPYQPNFATGRYLREYLSIFQGTDTMFSNRTTNIARNDFPNGYAIWIFDLAPDLGSSGCFHIPKTGAVRIEVKFAAATNATVNLVCYAEFDTSFEIDKYRNVIGPGQ